MRRIRMTRSELYGVIRESVRSILSEDDAARYDKYGNEIKRGGQGWGVDPSMANRQGYDENGNPSQWFSRSVAVATAVLARDGGEWYVLANERGPGTPDYQGYWNLPCGYLDYNETAEQAAVREVYEETGIRCNNIKNVGHSTSPNENRQNVCFFFVSFLDGGIDDYQFSKDNMEEGEVGGIRWVPVSEAKDVQWAFDHDGILQKIFTRYSGRMYGDDDDYTAPVQIVDKVIELVRNDADQEYTLSLLKRLRRMID